MSLSRLSNEWRSGLVGLFISVLAAPQAAGGIGLRASAWRSAHA